MPDDWGPDRVNSEYFNKLGLSKAGKEIESVTCSRTIRLYQRPHWQWHFEPGHVVPWPILSLNQHIYHCEKSGCQHDQVLHRSSRDLSAVHYSKRIGTRKTWRSFSISNWGSGFSRLLSEIKSEESERIRICPFPEIKLANLWKKHSGICRLGLRNMTLIFRADLWTQLTASLVNRTKNIMTLSATEFLL